MSIRLSADRQTTPVSEAVDFGRAYAAADSASTSSSSSSASTTRPGSSGWATVYGNAPPYQGDIGAVVPTSFKNVYVDAFARGPNMNYDLVRGMATRAISKTELQSQYRFLPPSIRNYLQQAAESMGGRSGSALWDDLVNISADNASYGIYKDPLTLFWEGVQSGQFGGAGAGSAGGGGYYGGGGGGGGGTSTTTVYTNKEDARVLVDQLSLELIGRTVNNEEFERLYGTLRAAEQASPTIVTSDGVNTVQEQGLGQAGRQEVLMDELRKDDNFADYQVESQMVNMFTSYLDERGVFANGI